MVAINLRCAEDVDLTRVCGGAPPIRILNERAPAFGRPWRDILSVSWADLRSLPRSRSNRRTPLSKLVVFRPEGFLIWCEPDPTIARIACGWRRDVDTAREFGSRRKRRYRTSS